MKKLTVFVICFIFLFTLAACGNDAELLDRINTLEDKITSLENDNASLLSEIELIKASPATPLPSFADCEIGYKLGVYPFVAFDYNYYNAIIHIENITAFLTAKNEIKQGDTVEHDNTVGFYPYEVTITVTGNVSNRGDNIGIAVEFIGDNLRSTDEWTIPVAIQSDGTFTYTKRYVGTNNCIVYFNSCSLFDRTT